jgi:hypothetical protein
LPSSFCVISPYVRRRSGEMNQPELIIDVVERLGLPEKQVSMGEKVLVEVFNHAPFRGEVEVNENIAAEDHIHAPHECHLSVV